MSIIWLIAAIAVVGGSVKLFIRGVVNRDERALKDAFTVWGLILVVVLWWLFMAANHVPKPPTVDRDPYGYNDDDDR